MENTERKFNLKTVLTILFWGALWGIVEATLGTLLHLPGFEETGLFFSSSAIIVPIAYCLMANCYKRTESFYAVYLMGVVAGLIKLTVAFVIGFTIYVYFPAMYIVLEALAMGTALAVFRPKNVLSLKTFVAIVVANTVYQFVYLCVRSLTSASVFASMEAFNKTGVKYLFTLNGLAIIYTLIVGSMAYGVTKLAEKFNWSMKFDLNKVITHPVTVGIALALAVGLTIGLGAI